MGKSSEFGISESEFRDTPDNDQSGNAIGTDVADTTTDGHVLNSTSRTPKPNSPNFNAPTTAATEEPSSGKSANGNDNGGGDDAKKATTIASNAGRSTLVGNETKLPMNFSIGDLTPDQAYLLDAVAKAYGLNPTDSQPTIDANLAQAMIFVAARMTQEERDNVGFTQHDLVSECIVDGEPCDMDNDFQKTFDVDYGNCYTFNYAYQPEVKYVTKRTGSAYGLKMIVISDSSEYLATSSLQGIKVVVHQQESHPFPNSQGYMSSVGQQVGLVVSKNKYSRLGAPYGNCSTLESLAAVDQPFYYNGSYSTEGCFRSCFQQNIIAACGCTDPRFPYPEEDGIEYCTPLDAKQRSCYEDYIAQHGDYYSVKNCSCYNPCEASTYSARMYEANWPAGDFFYGGFCPKANYAILPNYAAEKCGRLRHPDASRQMKSSPYLFGSDRFYSTFNADAAFARSSGQIFGVDRSRRVQRAGVLLAVEPALAGLSAVSAALCARPAHREAVLVEAVRVAGLVLQPTQVVLILAARVVADVALAAHATFAGGEKRDEHDDDNEEPHGL